MSSEFKVSARALVEYVLRSGSIYTGFQTMTQMSEGTRIHKEVQGQYAEADQKEVYLKTRINAHDIEFLIEGRCDGLLYGNDRVTIDEIKSTSGEFDDLMEDTHPVHWAQAKVYAYIYAKDTELENIDVQLTYVHIPTGQLRRFKKKYSFDELRDFIYDMAENFYPYARWQVQHLQARNKSMRKIDFPFPEYRAGQRRLSGAVYKTIKDGKNLFANAPTGIGKTISAIFPVIKAFSDDHLNKFFYLTAKTITRVVAEETLALLTEKGMVIKAVTITAKEKICFQDEAICTPGACQYADGYYDRLNEALLDVLENEQIITRKVIEEYSKKHRLCPFEFSLDLAYNADAIIGDYNYIFNPRVSLKRLLEEQKKRTAVLVDEAHNLVDRARDMYSAELVKSTFLQLKREFQHSHAELYQVTKELNQFFINVRKQAGAEPYVISEALPEQLILLLKKFTEQGEGLLADTAFMEQHPLLLDAYFSSLSFLRIAELFDEHFVYYIESGSREVRAKLLCLDPSDILRKISKGFRSRINFSATLEPMPYYIEMLGGQEGDFSISVPTPFLPEQVEVYIKKISTRYNDRQTSAPEIAQVINQLILSRSGNYLVFFPSYQYMSMVYEEFTSISEIQTIIQEAGMGEQEREAFLERFDTGEAGTLVGFAVLGGVFSEGIDLKGDRLNGVMVVGVGLPQIGPERDIIKNYFQKHEKNGFDYAYVYPGMNKVLQAGGRLIRSEQDHGMIVLIDDRFLQRKYQSMLPDLWRDYTVL
ncbi:ATP-dependent DNA helicase [Peribacillus sp. SCS-155]|uniref:ATP-dependent DNA helicase n=1 Tax=Peribacillus sedimenti TaxID=3115297 RepID=UPI003905A2F3